MRVEQIQNCIAHVRSVAPRLFPAPASEPVSRAAKGDENRALRQIK